MKQITASALSRQLRKAGFAPVAPADHMRQGVKVKDSGRDGVYVVADFDTDREADRMIEAVADALDPRRYVVRRGPGNALMVSRREG